MTIYMNKKGFFFNFTISFLFVSLTGCSSAILESDGAKTQIVDGISASDLLYYESAGTFTSYGMRTLEDCRNDLRNQASRSGAKILRITSSEPATCLFTSEKTCFNMHADGFRQKSQ